MKNFTRSILVCAMICMYFFSFSQTFSDTLSSPLAIPDNACLTDSAEAVVVVTGIGTLGGTNKIIDEVCIDITHTWCGDVEISLISPDDTEVLLMADLGSQTDGMNICFDDDAAASVTTVPTADGTIIMGSYIPLNALSTFNGESADGDWKVTICDDANGDTGVLDSWNITFVDPPSCSAPTGVSSSNITAEASTIIWTDGLGCSSVVIEYDTSGFTIGMGDQITPGCGVGTAGLTGLDSQTDYEYYIIQTCTTSAMDTVGPFSFTTLCDVFTTPSLEDFTTFLPACWNEAADGTPATGPTGLGTGSWAVDGFGNVGTTGAARVNLFTTNQNEWLLTPQYDLTGGPYSAQFDIALTAFAGTGAENFGSDDEVQFLITDDGGATWTNLQTWNATTPVSNTGDFEIVDLAAYSGAVQFAFYATDGPIDDAEDVDFFVDNFVIDVPPSCLNPTVSDTVRVSDCASPFRADIVIGTDGTGTMFTISDTIGTTPITNVLPGSTTSFGNYPIGTVVSIFITDEDDGTCVVERIVQVTDECPPDCPISLDLPVDGAIDVDLSVLLTWSAPTTGGQPTGYQVIFSQVNPPVDTLGTAGDTSVTIFALTFNTTYYWSISPINDAGEATGCVAAEVNSFTTKSPPAGPIGVSCTTSGFDPAFVYEETFDAAAFPSGWSGDLGTGTTNQMWNVRSGATGSTGTGPTGASDGTFYMYYEATGTDPADSVYVTTDTIDLTNVMDEAELSFDLHMFGPSIGTLDVGVSTSAVGPWTSVFNWVGAIQQTSADTFISVAANMDAYVGQKVFLHFAATYGGGFEGDIAVDKIKIESCTNCSPAGNVATSAVSFDQAIVSWTDGVGCADINILVDTTGNAIGNGISFNPGCGVETSTLTVLNAEVTYDYYLISECISGQIDTLGPFTFTTSCTPLTTPSLELFDTFVPDCWDEATSGTPATGPGGLGAGNWTADGFGNVGTTGAARINLFVSSVSDWLLTPSFDLTGGPYSALFDIALTDDGTVNPGVLGSDDEIQFLISDDGGTSWTNLMTWNSSTSISNTGTFISIDLTAYSGIVQFAFYATDGVVDDPEDTDFFVDNFAIDVPPSCLPISNLGASEITSDGAKIKWNSGAGCNSIDVEYGPTPYTPGTGTMISLACSADSVTFSGLISNTEYEVLVINICTGLSDTSNITFTTDCAAFTPPYINTIDAVPPDDCWDEATSGTPATGPQGIGTGAWIADGFGNVGSTGAAKINIYSDFISDWLLTPSFDLTGGPYSALFDIALTDFGNTNPEVLGSDDEVQFLISDDGGATWVNLMTWNSTTPISSTGEFINIDLSTYSGIVQFAFYGSSGSIIDVEDVDFFVDNFAINVPPSCLPVTDLSVSEITSDSAKIKWTSGLGCDSMDIEYGPTPYTPGTGTMLSLSCSSDSVTLSGLTAFTEYEVLVINICTGEADTNNITFTTECGVFTPPYFSTIENVPPDDCWEEASTGTPATGPTDLGLGSWGEDGFGNVGFSGSARINIFSNTLSDWLLTPSFDLTGGPFSLIYDAAMTGFSGTADTMLGSDDQVLVLITIDSGATWQTLKTYDNASIVPAVGINETIDLTAYSNVVQFAFYGTDGAVVDPNDVNFYIDNFEIRDQTATPTCIVLSSPIDGAIDVSQDADLTWPASPSATGYRINMGTTPGGTEILSGLNVFNVTTYDPDTLHYSQEYFVTIIPYNGNGPTFGCDESSFKVVDIPCGVVDAEVSGISENSATLTWTDLAGCQDLDIEFGVSPYIPGSNAATNVGCGTGTAALTSLTANTTYDVLIINTCAIENDTVTLTFTTNCSSFAVPYCEDFDDNADLSCWRIDDVDDEGDTWAFEVTANSRSGDTAAVASWDFTNPKDDWLFTPAFDLTGGTEYTISFAFRALGSGFPESMELLAGTGASPVDMTTTIFSMIDFNHTNYVLAVTHFTPVTSGDYNLGFHAISGPNEFDILMDDFCISECASSMVMNSDSIGTGSLMDVIMNHCGGDVIMFDASTNGDTIPFTGVMLNSPLSIMGNGSGSTTLSGSGSDRLFWIRPSVEVTLKDMSLINSNTAANGGALVNEGNLNLENVILAGNTENSNAKSMTIKPGSTTTVDGTVEAKE